MFKTAQKYKLAFRSIASSSIDIFSMGSTSAVSMAEDRCEFPQFPCVRSLTMDTSAALKELSEPWERGDKIKRAIERSARIAGLSYSRCFEIWYGRARRIEPAEIARISDALDHKKRMDTRNELSELRLRLARLENVLLQTDPDFHRPAVDLMRTEMRRSR